MTIARETQEEIQWFDPLKDGSGRPFVWEDGIHVIKRVEIIPLGIGYTLNCGTMFTFTAIHPILEAAIRLPEPTCKECLS